MHAVPTPDEMRAADAAAIAAGTPGHVLMERAGRRVAHAALSLLGARYGRRAVVVCGAGNNGGDGFVAARALGRAGAGVLCGIVGDRERIRGDALLHLREMEAAGVPARPFDESMLERADVVVDAIFGTGFRGSAEGAEAETISAINRRAAPVVAVDIPSGLDGSTGAASGPAVRAAVTVALGAPKIGTLLGSAAAFTGRLLVADIGIPVAQTWARLAEEPDVAAALGDRPPDAHKRSKGVVVVFAGSDEVLGAPLLTARSASRAGAGYVVLCSTPSVRRAAATAAPEVVTRSSGEALLGADAVDAVADLLPDASAVAVGPGIGTGTRAAELVARLAEEVSVPLVVDADALTLLADDRAPLERRGAPAILTPHPGELGRLLRRPAAEVAADPAAAGRAVAERFPRVVVLVKGPRSLVVAPGGTRAVVADRGGPELATAGTGDVLTGVIAALVAETQDPFTAAWASAWLHGSAGALAAERRGRAGVVAMDVAEELAAARAALRRQPPLTLGR
ncbi:MAG TPA: NAD(P)H-hydrate dehydratase [Actinomycetota bacterium]|nr:NAD(P)H-hydrate dehydratase [Actinomycetota bacterium]